MAEAIDIAMFNRFSNYSRQPAIRQIALLFGLAASVALGLGLVQWTVKPDFKPLFGTMAPEDMNSVIAALEAGGIDYNMDGRSGMVAVPAGDIHRARLLLASDGYPRAEGVGFESLYREQEIGLSTFMEQARYHRSLEAELSRTIASMDSVRGARVHLAMAKQTAFLRAREKPAASVMLGLYAGQSLGERQLAGIVHLVASSVPNLEAEQVSVVDQQGRLLSRQGVDEGMGFTREQFRHNRRLEDDYRQRIIDILEPILGVGAVHAQVAADIDFTRVERTSETYAPDTVMRSEQTTEEVSNQRLAGGIPGALSNQPPVDTEVSAEQPDALGEGAGTAPPARTSRRATRNFEVDKTISHIYETPGAVRKLSVAVVLDHVSSVAEDGSTERAAMTQERIDEITGLIREAVGFNAGRGDTVSVISASFVTEELLEVEVFETSIMEQDWVWQLAKTALTGIVLLSLVFFVLRPLMKFSTAPLMAQQRALQAQGASPMLGSDGMDDDQVTLASMDPTQQGGLAPGQAASGPAYQQQLLRARSMATGEPERAAHVVKDWVSADG
ncbi:MAG: flagellar M-ring protein FliF [Halieaceae bacterium]|jgi:flagellar M-ring protein FliF